MLYFNLYYFILYYIFWTFSRHIQNESKNEKYKQFIKSNNHSSEYNKCSLL